MCKNINLSYISSEGCDVINLQVTIAISQWNASLSNGMYHYQSVMHQSALECMSVMEYISQQ